MDGKSISRVLFDERFHSPRWLAVEQEVLEEVGGDADAAIVLFLHRILNSEPTLRMELEEVARTCVRMIVVQEMRRQGFARDTISA
jgi:hypothetical protein